MYGGNGGIYMVFFDFLLFTLLLIFAFLFLLKWYFDREDFQIMLSNKKLSKKITPPIFVDQQNTNLHF